MCVVDSVNNLILRKSTDIDQKYTFWCFELSTCARGGPGRRCKRGRIGCEKYLRKAEAINQRAQSTSRYKSSNQVDFGDEDDVASSNDVIEPPKFFLKATTPVINVLLDKLEMFTHVTCTETAGHL